MPLFLQSPNSAVAVKSTSPEELSAVSMGSQIALMMKPSPTGCMAMPLEMPNSKQAKARADHRPDQDADDQAQ